MNNPDNVLLVEDEPGVLQTFAEWLESSGFGINVHKAKDAESALKIASENQLDLAILDWNLGAGLNGLDLLEDLFIFHPDIVAILVTGYANQATPLHAMRIGVRDYLDKSQDLTREKFLGSVLNQLKKIRPIKSQRAFQKKLEAFKVMVSKSLEMIDSNTAFKNENSLESTSHKILKVAFEMQSMKIAALYQIGFAGFDPSAGCLLATYDGITFNSSRVDFGSSVASSACNQSSGIAMKVDISKFSNRDLFVLQPFEANARCALFLPLKHQEELVGILELVDPVDSGSIKFADLCDIYAELLSIANARDKAKNQLIMIMEKALKLADPLNNDNLSAKSLGETINNAIEGTGISSEEIEFLSQVRILQNRFGNTALNSSTELLKTVEKMLASSFGEASK